MRWATSLPQFVDDGEFNHAAFRRHLERAEQLGFESAWAQEGVLGSASLVSPIELMTFAAACTEHLRLGCAVFVLPLHQPVHLAKSIASLDQLSCGRIEIGVGTGGRVRPFAAFEVAPEAGLVARFNEGLQLMKLLWTEPLITHHGRFWRLDGETMEPKPFQKPHPPVWFGGHAATALERAVEHGDGFFGAGSATTTAFSAEVSILRDRLAQRGRDADAFPIAKRVYIAVDDDTDRVETRMEAALVRIYGSHGRQLSPVTVTGSTDACIAGLNDVAEAGADLIMLNTLFDHHEQMERLAADVMPHVR